MDKKKTVVRVGAVLIVALAAGHLVQTMSEGRDVAEAPRPTAVQPVSAGAVGGIPAAASLGAAAAGPETALPETATPEVALVEPPAAPDASADAPIPAALTEPAQPWSLTPEADAAAPMPAPVDDLADADAAEIPNVPQPEDQAALPEAMTPEPTMLEPSMPLETGSTVAAGECATDLVLTAGPQAMISVSITAPCRAGERVVLRHGGVAIAESLGADGSLALDFPALDTRGELSALFSDAEVLTDSVALPDAADRYAVQWMGDDVFQLHAFENGADYGQPGDVNASSPVSPSGGYLVSLGNPTLDFPMMAEIYTWPADATVSVDLVIESAVTELTCGRELLGEVVQAKDAGRTVNELTLAMPDCDAVGDILVLNNPGQDVTLASSN